MTEANKITRLVEVRLRVPQDVHTGILRKVVDQKASGIKGASMERLYIQAVTQSLSN